MGGIFNRDLDRVAANYQPLTPLTFLLRAEETYPDRTAAIYGERAYSWKEYGRRCRKLASALVRAGVSRGDTVSILAPNTLAMLEVQFGVPLSGAVLNCLNSRLDAPSVRFILEHAETRVFLVDRGHANIAREALKGLSTPPTVIDIDDPDAAGIEMIGTLEYEAFLDQGKEDDPVRWPEDEWDAIALNYTSGTTGDPKGVVYHHRGAYLNAIGQIINAQMSGEVPRYLWTLPLFHCNGWCFAWGLAAVGATQVCIRKVNAETIYNAIEKHRINLFCGAPTVLGFLIDGCPKDWTPPAQPVRVFSGGASPPPQVFRRLEALGFECTHLYGMTEMHGVATRCEPQDNWGEISVDERLRIKGRQGVREIVLDEMIVADPVTLVPVSRDGQTLGEILMRGNVTMKGYLKNPKATAEAFKGNWYHTGDLAVVYPDGYIEIKDRSKDVIISGGENISSVELEELLYSHPAVANVAVVAVPDERWGETPCAIIELKPDLPETYTEADFIAFCKSRVAGFKCPKHVIFEPLVRTATGKLQKFKLRSFAAARLSELHIS